MLSRRSIIVFMSSVALGGHMGSARAAGETPPPGEWSGTLRVDAQTFRLTLRILSDTRGELISPDQSPEAVPADLRMSGSVLTVAVPSAQASFVGKLEGNGLVGEWRQGGLRLPLTLVRGAPPSPAQPDHVTPLTQDTLERLRLASGAPALGAGWQKRGAGSQILVSGKRAADAPMAVTPLDLWHLGSVTKSLTATLVARLIDAGVVRWTDTVQSVLGDRISGIHPAYRDVNFLHLLSHHSGLPSEIPQDQWKRYFNTTKTPVAQRPGFATQALALPPVGVPGKVFRYSNLGITIAALMLETRTGSSWEKLITDQVFVPLRLATAGFGAPPTDKDVRQPVGHAATGADTPDAQLFAAYPETGRTVDNPAVIGPAGNVHMSIADLLTFLAAHRDRAPLLSGSSWERLHTPPFGDEQALGLVVRPDGSLWHNGSNTLWYCEIRIDPERGIAAAAVANRFSSGSRAAVADALAAAGSAVA